MLTPIDIQNHSLKTAVRGYSKKETDDFLEEILKGYEELYKENRELKDKITSLSEGIQYYKQMETTLQKALVLAEKTSTETQEAAKSKADAMTSEAQAKADAILKEAQSEAEALRKETQAYSEITKAKANRELEETRNHVRKLVQSYENYRLQFKKLAESQIEMLESENYSIFAPELEEMLDDAPDADAVMDAEKMVAINQKSSEQIASESVGDIASGEKKNDLIEEEIVVQSQKSNPENEIDDTAVKNTDTIDLMNENVEESAEHEEETVTDEANKEEILEDDIEIEVVADTQVSESEPMEESVLETDSEDDSKKEEAVWENTTPKIEGYLSDDTKTVSPNSEMDSPFTFIDTE